MKADTLIRLKPFAALIELSPAYFGMVMATGIISLTAHQLDRPTIATPLFLLNNIVYLALWFLTVLRLIQYPRQFFDDMVDHMRGPGFFTVVAATSILGAQYVLLANDYRIGTILWIAAILLWAGLTYTVFVGFTIKDQAISLDDGISGAWLLAVVATQSIAVLSALLAVHVSTHAKLEMNFLALSMWLLGGMLYIWMISLIFYRYTFFSLSPSDLSPPYWINMGAMAISTLAGSLLIINASDAPFLTSLLPFIKGFTILYWATGTWWIPMLVILGIWRYVYKQLPMQYSPLYWGAVFPLGMYAASVDRMSEALELNFVEFLAPCFFYIALTAWAMAFSGFIRDQLRRVRTFWS
jgi:tellurite resistance protein TehA-like permease